jgi:hypothetical protein
VILAAKCFTILSGSSEKVEPRSGYADRETLRRNSGDSQSDKREFEMKIYSERISREGGGKGSRVRLWFVY